MPRLLHELAVGRGDGSYTRLLTRLAKLDLLAIDDWMLAPLGDTERRDLTGGHRGPRRARLDADRQPVAGDRLAFGVALLTLLASWARVDLRAPSARVERVGTGHFDDAEHVSISGLPVHELARPVLQRPRRVARRSSPAVARCRRWLPRVVPVRRRRIVLLREVLAVASVPRAVFGRRGCSPRAARLAPFRRTIRRRDAASRRVAIVRRGAARVPFRDGVSTNRLVVRFRASALWSGSAQPVPGQSAGLCRHRAAILRSLLRRLRGGLTPVLRRHPPIARSCARALPDTRSGSKRERTESS